MNLKPMRTIAQELASIVVGDPVYFGGLTVFPLFRTGSTQLEPGYTLLDDAVERGVARVTEVGDVGLVPELRFENLGESPVLLVDGEELVGAKQNRVVNLTILAPAKKAIAIPVSCVEAHRWRAETEAFRPAEHIMYSRARAAKAAQVSHSMVAGAGRNSDQSAIWNDIDLKLDCLRVTSPTGAMKAMYDSNAGAVDAYVQAFTWTAGQVGLVFSIGAETMGFDLLDHPHAMQAMLPKLVRSYALDAIETPQSVQAARDAAAGFLQRIGKAELRRQPAIGIGEDVRLTGEGISGAALWAEERYIHVCAFSTH
jgi:hypothetical protein